MSENSFRERRLLHLLCVSYAAIWIMLAIDPLNRRDWAIENLLVFVAVPVLILTYRRLPLSDTTYVLFFLFLLLHAVGAHYTYAKVPLGFWLKDAFDLERNHFDRFVHFSFGIMVYPIQEVFVRITRETGFWARVLPAAIIISFSGFFEILEALIVMIVDPDLGTAYLGLQGDVWDAQKDMGLAIVAAVIVVSFIDGSRHLRASPAD